VQGKRVDIGGRRIIKKKTTKTSCSASTGLTPASLAVEKGEASSTTSSPKTELIQQGGKTIGTKTLVSPVSSSNPELVSSTVSPPNSLDEDGGVSSTTKELDIKSNSLRDPLKIIKKEALDPFSLLNSKEVKLMDKTELFAPIIIHKHSKDKDKKLKENKKESSNSGSRESSNKYSR